MASAKITRSISTPAFNLRETRTRTGTSAISVVKTLPQAFYGVLATRPTANTGVIVVNTEDHGLVSGLAAVDLYFENGVVCLNAEITNVTGEVLTVNTADSLLAQTIPNTIGIGMAVSPHVTFSCDVADVSEVIVMSYGLKYYRTSGLTFPVNAHMILNDGGAPDYQVFSMTPPNGVLWDVDSLNFSESDLGNTWTLPNLNGGTISCPSHETGASFRLYALINTPGTGT